MDEMCPWSRVLWLYNPACSLSVCYFPVNKVCGVPDVMNSPMHPSMIDCIFANDETKQFLLPLTLTTGRATD